MIIYTDTLEGISADQLQGFFVGWPNPPTPETHLRLLQGSSQVVLAIDAQISMVIGFITALSDGILSAYIPFLEVLPAYQQRGIGRELVRLMLAKLEGHYMIDLLCDPELQGFYSQFGMHSASGMMIRNFGKQSGMS